MPHIRVYGLALLLAGLAMMAMAGNFTHSNTSYQPAAKPLSPLQLTLRPVGDVQPGVVSEFSLQLQSAVTASEVSVSVELPVGSQLLSAGMPWSGSVAKGESRSWRIRVILPANAQHINAVAQIKRADGASQFGASQRLSLPFANVAASVSNKTQAPPKSLLRFGEQIVEYPAE